jgi:hypothetical protein
MFDRIRALIVRWHELKEIEALSERDLDDLGMTRDQVRAFAAMPPDVPDRVAAMGAIFGLNPAELKANHALWLDLLETCGGCGDRGACGLVLAKGDLGRAADCSFCRNRVTFEGLAARSAA